jgi:ATP-dependent Clp protease protease subunit
MLESAPDMASPTEAPHPREMTRFEEPAREEPVESRSLPSEVRENLFRSRTVLLFGEITSELARSTSAQLLALAAASDDPIRVLVHSPGGHVESGDTIHDVIRFIRPEVLMIGTGWVASAAALIYVAAKRENRFALPSTRYLLHQPLGGIRGPASDIEIEAAQIASIRARLTRTFAEATGRDPAQVAAETERNLWMTAEEARAYGLVHRIVASSSEV